MEIYKILMEVNRKEIFGEDVSNKEKQEIISSLLKGRACREDVVTYKKRMRVNPETDNIYPNYYIPPFNDGKKLRLIQGYLPKTNILYANHYELEILRLLYLYAPENSEVNEMVQHTLKRLEKTCFANSCTQGECLATGISVLRFLAATQKGLPLSYLLLAFTDINSETTKGFIAKKKEWLLELLRKGWITGKLSNGKESERDSYNLMGKYIIRNALGTLPEYGHTLKCEIYVSDEDERCYCNI